MLTADQIAFYRKNGYLVCKEFFTPADMDSVRRELDVLIERSRSVTSNNELFDLEDTHSAEQPQVRRIKHPDRHMKSVGSLLRGERLVGAVSQLLGPNIRMQMTKLNMKTAGVGSPVEWHQDWAFVPFTNDDLLAVGVMIDDVTEENGPLLVIPGSHKGPIHNHHCEGRFCGAINPAAEGLDVGQAVKLIGPAGSISLHHVRTVHGSALNNSNKDRRLLLFDLCAADAWPLFVNTTHYKDYDDLVSRMIAGTQTLTPRMTDVPLRMPLPPQKDMTSIYETQRNSRYRSFETAAEAKAKRV